MKHKSVQRDGNIYFQGHLIDVMGFTQPNLIYIKPQGWKCEEKKILEELLYEVTKKPPSEKEEKNAGSQHQIPKLNDKEKNSNPNTLLSILRSSTGFEPREELAMCFQGLSILSAPGSYLTKMDATRIRSLQRYNLNYFLPLMTEFHQMNPLEVAQIKRIIAKKKTYHDYYNKDWRQHAPREFSGFFSDAMEACERGFDAYGYR